MLRGNLSSRPFYNERLVTLALALLAVVALALTAFNGSRLLSLSGERRGLKARIERDQAETARVRTNTTVVSQSINGSVLAALADSTREANEIIDRRTFSWTAFFDQIERVMPFDVRLEAVTPRVEKGVFKVAIIIVARNAQDVDEFMDALEGTGAFRNAVPKDQNVREDGSYTALIDADYLAVKTASVPEAAPVASPAVEAPSPAAPAPAAPTTPAGRGRGGA